MFLDPDFNIMQQSHGLFAIAKLLVIVVSANGTSQYLPRGTGTVKVECAEMSPAFLRKRHALLYNR